MKVERIEEPLRDLDRGRRDVLAHPRPLTPQENGGVRVALRS